METETHLPPPVLAGRLPAAVRRDTRFGPYAQVAQSHAAPCPAEGHRRPAAVPTRGRGLRNCGQCPAAWQFPCSVRCARRTRLYLLARALRAASMRDLTQLPGRERRESAIPLGD